MSRGAWQECRIHSKGLVQQVKAKPVVDLRFRKSLRSSFVPTRTWGIESSKWIEADKSVSLWSGITKAIAKAVSLAKGWMDNWDSLAGTLSVSAGIRSPFSTLCKCWTFRGVRSIGMAMATATATSIARQDREFFGRQLVVFSNGNDGSDGNSKTR